MRCQLCYHLVMKTQTITYYIANDGTKFTDEAKCVDYEFDAERIKEILEPLGPDPVLSGKDYITHDISTVLTVRNNFLTFAKSITNWGSFADHFDGAREQTEHNQTFVGRLIDDAGTPAVKKAWFRFMCIDMGTGREYSQPFYAFSAYDNRVGSQ